MFSLADKVLSDDLRIGTVIGNHGNFRRTGKHVDTDAAIEGPLGFGNKTVARTNQDTCRFAGEQTKCHCRDSLNAAKSQNGISTTLVHRVENGRIRTILAPRRGTGDDMFDTGNARCRDRHDGRGHMGVPSPRNITSGSFDRDQLLPCPEAG